MTEKPRESSSDTIASIEKIGALNDSIAQQNQEFEKGDSLALKSLRSIVQSDITDRQIDSFHELLTVHDSEFYDELYGNMHGAAIDLAAQQQATQLHTEMADAELANLQDSVDLAVSLAPRRKVELEQVAQIEADKIKKRLSRHAIDQAQQRFDDMSQRFEVLGRPWVIPTAISPEDRMAMYDLIEDERAAKDEHSAIKVQTDIIPVTPEERAHQAEVAEKARRTVENADASNFITYYLAENLDKVVTVDELARFLYVADVDQHRTHITTLLGPKVQGKRIQRLLLEDYGLVLQYGFRRLQRVEGDRRVEERRTRIYRAIDPSSVGHLEDVISRAVTSNDKIIADEFDALDILPIQDVEKVQQSFDTSDNLQPQVEEAGMVTDLVEEKSDWLTEFTAAIDSEIDKLIADNLFVDDTMRGLDIRTRSSSNIFGTETMRLRLRAAGLMKVNEVKGDTMNREQRVLGGLFNAHQTVLGQRTKRKSQAVQLVKERINARLEAMDDISSAPNAG